MSKADDNDNLSGGGYLVLAVYLCGYYSYGNFDHTISNIISSFANYHYCTLCH